jgi:tetratricopeptide (TPR) repeat protein
LNTLGLVALALGRPQAARERLRESLALRREAGNHWGLANGLFNLGLIAMALGDYAEALARF